MDRQAPYKDFDRVQLRDFLRGRRILSVELLQGGKRNTSYKLALNDGGTYVLRLHSKGDPQRETYLMDLVRDLVPVPLEIDRGDGWSVFSFLEGDLLEGVPQHSGAAAEALARISSVEFESPGWVNPDGSISPFPFEGTRGFIGKYGGEYG